MVELDQEQLKFVDAITKYTTISCISITSTIAGCIVGAIEFVLFDNDYIETAEYTLPMICLDCFISIMCLYFTFAFANKHYYKWCKCCHKNCSKICVRLSTEDYNKEMRKHYTTKEISLASDYQLYEDDRL